ncbi:MAG: hypothetical protein K8R60_18790 [Burkholderiales bacterium]|nr:hypothetical protein [Burkholderiales bacterium]
MLRGFGLVLAAIVIFFEEWGWRPLTAGAAWLARLLHLQRLEAWISASPPWVALLLFLAPAVLLFPLKLAALWLIGEGRAGTGVFIIVAAKVLGTAFVGRLFILVEPQLMTFAWFARALNWWRQTKAKIVEAVRRSAPWRTARALRKLWLARLKKARS